MPRYVPIHYKSNPNPLPGRPQSIQGRVADQQTGKWTYSGYIVSDDYGTLVDARGDGYDRDRSEGDGPALASMDNQGGYYEPFPDPQGA